MDLFTEKRFIERFEKENNPERYTYVQEIISTIFSRYANIRLFTDASFNFREDSELLTKLSDTNTDIKWDYGFDVFNRDIIPAPHTIILTEEPRQWFNSMKKQGALCYSYDSYENEIRKFIGETHIDIDLADPDIYPFDWTIFKYLGKYQNFIIITDPYILNDKKDEKIKDNLIALLKNLDVERDYKMFMIAEVSKVNERKINEIVKLICQYLEGFKVTVYLINRLNGVKNMRIHDRYLYTNHVMVNCGIGFNLSRRNPELSGITGKSILDYTTYRKFRTHFMFLKNYLKEIEKLNPKQEYKTNDNGSFKSFFEIADCIS